MTELITDRTESDVLLGNEKGRYRYSDLNRVECAVAQLCQLAAVLDIHPGLTTKCDWDRPDVFSAQDWPVSSQMVRYLQNIHTLCDTFGISKAQLPDSMELLNWKKANAIEQALLQIYELIHTIINTFCYGGELFSGEESL